MKTAISIVSTALFVFVTDTALSETRRHERNADRTSGIVSREDTDGILERDEYRTISENGAVTRRPCPYSCSDRGVPEKSCKTWHSKLENECYVQDLRQPSDVFAKRADTQIQR